MVPVIVEMGDEMLWELMSLNPGPAAGTLDQRMRELLEFTYITGKTSYQQYKGKDRERERMKEDMIEELLRLNPGSTARILDKRT